MHKDSLWKIVEYTALKVNNNINDDVTRKNQ